MCWKLYNNVHQSIVYWKTGNMKMSNYWGVLLKEIMVCFYDRVVVND